ncbi:hypothetical protein [Pseudonocardia acidicola]|uniref:Uncharacterized protein n=1 Tax=Pseudonocardia acidicola TaxID=2724939 RepID=A0ABX1SES4_9PSEU|nr:hypothetical protein [Pseudonocardia acidicola]NMH98749.1 hypothetical protein [Pseudonocardia acidicola]
MCKDPDQLSLDLDLGDERDEPVRVVGTPAESAAVEPEAEVAGNEIVVDESQTALFAVAPSPTDVAAATYRREAGRRCTGRGR